MKQELPAANFDLLPRNSKPVRAPRAMEAEKPKYYVPTCEMFPAKDPTPPADPENPIIMTMVGTAAIAVYVAIGSIVLAVVGAIVLLVLAMLGIAVDVGFTSVSSAISPAAGWIIFILLIIAFRSRN